MSMFDASDKMLSLHNTLALVTAVVDDAWCDTGITACDFAALKHDSLSGQRRLGEKQQVAALLKLVACLRKLAATTGTNSRGCHLRLKHKA